MYTFNSLNCLKFGLPSGDHAAARLSAALRLRSAASHPATVHPAATRTEPVGGSAPPNVTAGLPAGGSDRQQRGEPFSSKPWSLFFFSWLPPLLEKNGRLFVAELTDGNERLSVLREGQSFPRFVRRLVQVSLHQSNLCCQQEIKNKF